MDACLDSFARQSYPNLELIVVNDGSKDKTSEVIRDFKQRKESNFSRFVFIDKENEGVNKTLNCGLSHAQGEYVFLCSSDDKVTPNAISDLYEQAKQDPQYGLIVGNCLIMDDDDEPCCWDRKRQNVYSSDDAKYLSFSDYLKVNRDDVDFYSDQFGSYASLLKGNYIPNGFLIKMSLMKEIGFYDDTAPLEDHALMLDLSKLTKFKYIDSDVYYYRWHDENTIKKMHKNIVPLDLQMFSREVLAVSSRNLTDLVPVINEVYALQNPEVKFYIPGLLKIERFKYNESRKYHIEVFGLNIWIGGN